MTDREIMQQALSWADQHGEVVYSGGGWDAVNGMNEWAQALRSRLAQPEQEPVAWRNAAIRVGEELSSVGPDGYYNMTAQQWLDWAMAQEPRGKNSLAQPEQETAARLTCEELGYVPLSDDGKSVYIDGFGVVPLAQPERESATKAGELRAMKDEFWKQPEQEPIKESSITHGHLWIGELWRKEKNT